MTQQNCVGKVHYPLWYRLTNLIPAIRRKRQAIWDNVLKRKGPFIYLPYTPVYKPLSMDDNVRGYSPLWARLLYFLPVVRRYANRRFSRMPMVRAYAQRPINKMFYQVGTINTGKHDAGDSHE